MPGNIQGGYPVHDVLLVVGIGIAALRERAIHDWVAEGSNIVLVFKDGMNTQGSPEVDHSVGNHTGIAAGRGCSEGDCMVYEELSGTSLKDEPGFVIGEGWTGAVELRNVNCTGLGAWWSQGNLGRERYEMV